MSIEQEKPQNLKNGTDIYEHVQLSKVYTKRTNEKAVCLAVLFFNVLPRHTNIMRDKGLNLFMNALPDVYICPFRKKSAPLLPEVTVKCIHLAA